MNHQVQGSLPPRIFPAGWSEQQAGRIPGNMAIWVGILSELTEFGLFFIAYFVAKIYYPEAFASGPQELNTVIGIVNTLVLISSSYFMAKAVANIRQNKRKPCEYYLWLTVLSACLYLALKTWEFHWNDMQGIHSNSSPFFTVYYYMTFNHFLHVGWAGCAIVWVIFRLRSGAYNAVKHSGLEALAVYWHMVDLMWILIFPLLYVLR